MEAKIALLTQSFGGEVSVILYKVFCVLAGKSFDIGKQQQNQQQVIQFQNSLQLCYAQYIISGAILIVVITHALVFLSNRSKLKSETKKCDQ